MVEAQRPHHTATDWLMAADDAGLALQTGNSRQRQRQGVLAAARRTRSSGSGSGDDDESREGSNDDVGEGDDTA